MKQHVAGSSLTVLGYDNLRHTVQVSSVLVLIDVIVLGTMHEEHHVGILFDGSRFAQVAQLRAFALKSFARLHSTVQLTQCQYRDVKLFGNLFQ